MHHHLQIHILGNTKRIAGLQFFYPNHPINLTIPAFDTSPKIENTTLPLKLFQHPACFHSAIYKKFQIPLSLSPTDNAGTLANRALSPVADGPHLVRKLEVFRYSIVLSLSFAASLFLSLHISHLTGFVVRRQNRAPSSVPKRPGFHLVGKPPNPTVFTLSLPHSFSYLTSSLCCHRSSPARPIKGFAIRVRGPGLG